MLVKSMGAKNPGKGAVMANPKYEAFLKVAEVGSFKRAAEELGYTQAGISYMIAALEQDMGVSFFSRERTGATLTPDGRALLPLMQGVRNSERALRARLDDIHHLESGTVRIAAFASVAIHWLPGIVKEFLGAHPKIDVQISCVEDQSEVEERLMNGDFDCAFLVLPASHESLHCVPLAQDPIFAVVARSHPLARAPFFPTDALAHEPYIEVRGSAHSEFDALFERHGVKPSTRFVLDNDFAAMGMVSEGLGFSLFAKLMLRDAPFDLALVPPEIPTHRELAIGLRSRDTASVATKAFVECARDWVKAR